MKVLLMMFLALTILPVVAQEKCKLRGRITSADGKAIPYCTVYLPELKNGSMANIDGEFSLDLPCGQQQVIFQSLGFESKRYSLILSSEKSLEVELKAVAYALEAVNIDPSSEDPAYNIIRKATAMAEFYKKQVDAYNCKLYIRSFYNMDNIPWIAEKLADEEDLKEMKAGDVNETLLEYSFKRPNIITEKILAKKSGSRDTSREASNYINLNFYNIGGSSIVNPLSKIAFQVYKYEYKNTQFQGNRKVHKVQVIPKRRGNDLMKGFLYINDESWSLNNVDVEFEQQFVKVGYQQRYAEIEPTVWFPINAKITAQLSAAGFKATVQYLATLSDLELITNPRIDASIRSALSKNIQADTTSSQERKDPKISNKSSSEEKIEELLSKDELNNREAIKLVRLIKKQERESAPDTAKSFEVSADRTTIYSDSAFAENDSLWSSEREVPLSKTEQKIYRNRDSILKVESGDTVIHEERTKIGNLLFFDGRLNTKNKNFIFRPYGLLNRFGSAFNTVDGFTLRKDLFEIGRNDFEGNFFSFKPAIEYAIARETWSGDLAFDWQYSKTKRGKLRAIIGRRTADFNGLNAISDELNTISSLLLADNYQKLYQEDFFKLNHHIDIINGLEVELGIDYAQRIGLRNYSSYTLFDRDEGDYTDNTPTHEEVIGDPGLLQDHHSMKLIGSISYTPNQYYTIKRQTKQILDSKYPTFKLQSTTGIPTIFESETDFQLLELSVKQSKSFGLIDEISYFLGTGLFLNTESLFFADYKSFATNPFYLLGDQKNSFKLLDYYQFNSSNQFLEAHFSVKDNFLLLKHLPWLNQTELKERIEINFLQTKSLPTYYEFGYSLEEIFIAFDIGIYTSFEDHDFQSVGFRLGVNFD